jgi:hypothetical protein
VNLAWKRRVGMGVSVKMRQRWGGGGFVPREQERNRVCNEDVVDKISERGDGRFGEMAAG